jgi:hypothetical protein
MPLPLECLSDDTSTIAITAVLGSALDPLMLSLFVGRTFKQSNAHSARIGTDQPPEGAKIETKRYEAEGGNISSILLAGGRIKEGGMKTCTHLNQIRNVTPRTPNGCEECLKMGDTWVHLRLCLECGHVGCCDSSKNKHATKHFHQTKHPIMKSLEPGENWGWCYIDELMLDFP